MGLIKPYTSYTDEQLEFLREHIKGRSYPKLAMMFNERFNTNLSRHTTSNICRFHRFDDVKPERQYYTAEQIEFLRGNYKGRYYWELTKLFNEHFSTSATLFAIREACRTHNIQNKMNGGFKKGHTINTGHALPDGTERVTVAGYVKIKKDGIWRGKHTVIWEEAHGAIPEDHYIVFGDGNKENLELNNLHCVSATEGGIRSMLNLKGSTPELAEMGIALAGLYAKIRCRTQSKQHLTIQKNKTRRGVLTHEQ